MYSCRPSTRAVGVRERHVEVVRDVLVELVVLLLRDLGLRPRPERRRLVDLLGGLDVARVRLLAGDLLLLHQDRNGDVVGVLLHDRPQRGAGEQLVLAVAQVQDDLGAARFPGDGFEGVLALAAALPAHRLPGAESGPAGRQRDAVGDDERRVEADAELADELRVLRLVAGELRDELAGARLGDGPDVVDHFLARHADAVVGDGDRARGRVDFDLDRQIGVLLEQTRFGQRFEAQLVASVRSVRDELAKEDLLVRVEGVDHQIEELAGLGLEFVGRPGRCLRHGTAPESSRELPNQKM